MATVLGKVRPVPEGAPVSRIEARDKPNSRWSYRLRDHLMTVPIEPLLGPNDVVFAIGSCFAERIRLAMAANDMQVGPPLGAIPMDPDNYVIDSLPNREHMNYYNTFTIRQEFERNLGQWKQEPDDFWAIPKRRLAAKNVPKQWDGDTVYQDPYRRAVFGRTPEALRAAVGHIDDAMDYGIRNASVFFMTFGMTEVFVNARSGKVACQKPGYAGGGGEAETQFKMSSYAQNLANLSATVAMIKSIRRDARIVLSVSPVPLSRTFGHDDIVVANMEGKSILRAAAGEIARRCDNVTYFPSYEMVMANSPASFRADDERHVADWIVSHIVSTFKAAHYADTTDMQSAAE